MPYVLVFLAAAAAGAGVAGLTIRNGRVAEADPETWTKTYREDAPAATEETVPTRGRPLPSAPTAQTRVIGIAGLAGTVLAGAAVLAFLAYLLWNMLKGIFT
jgi:hypothetical protein